MITNPGPSLSFVIFLRRRQKDGTGEYLLDPWEIRFPDRFDFDFHFLVLRPCRIDTNTNKSSIKIAAPATIR